MITAIDMVGTNQGSGTKTYNLNFCKYLYNRDIKEKIIIFITSDYLEDIKLSNKSNIHFVIKPSFLRNSFFRIIWMQFFFPFELKKYNVSQLFSPMNIGPVFIKLFGIKFVLGLHSNLPWVYFSKMPGNYIKKLIIKYFMQISVFNCDELIVNSHFAKKEIQNYISIDDQKIKVVYLGIKDQEKVPNFELESKSFENRDYFLSILSCVRYHNIINLLKAYKIIINKFDHKTNFILVMQVLDKDYFNEIKKFIDANFAKKKVIIYSNLDYKYLRNLYKNSRFYIFSSYCEVFGLTSLEAMSNNCPVLISNRSALKEINSDAAKYFDPDDIEEIAQMINEFLNNKKLIEELKRKGLKHSKKFSWDKTVSKTLEILSN